MAFKQSNTQIKTGINISVLLVILATLFFNPLPAFAEEKAPSSSLPDLGSFIQTVMNGQADTLRGVYVSGVLAMPVVQQPPGNPVFVSTTDNELTQFSMAAEVGNVGLLAHNYLAGTSFSLLAPGQEVRLIYGDGQMEYFTIRRIESYQALDPYSPYSEFRNLTDGVTITAEELFRRVYRGERHVTFQTCIEANGNSSWGRLFIIAEPKKINGLRNLLSHP
jgi:hypothetical protein